MAKQKSSNTQTQRFNYLLIFSFLETEEIYNVTYQMISERGALLGGGEKVVEKVHILLANWPLKDTRIAGCYIYFIGALHGPNLMNITNSRVPRPLPPPSRSEGDLQGGWRRR